MCGIAGILRFRGEIDDSDQNRVAQAISAIGHRGPDYNHCTTIDNACFGHARLSIIDTSSKGNQPMTDDSGRYMISYNGELYNYKSLREELIKSGIKFFSETDTEVALQAYIHYGVDCVTKFNGFFAFAIYDREQKTFFAARDRMGIKPIYYEKGENEFRFASELSAIRGMGGSYQLNHEALHLYFQLTYIPAPHSILKNVFKLLPGHYLLSRNGSIETKAYFDLVPDAPVDDKMTFENAKLKIRQELDRSVKMRLMADVPLGTFLSGGIDSAIITSVAARHQPGIETFSLGFKDNSYIDESELAGKVAQSFGTRHHRLMVSNADLTDMVESMLQNLDEPFADSSSVAVFALSKYSAQHVKVALSGDGGDELFGGYRKHAALLRSVSAHPTDLLVRASYPLLSNLDGGRGSALANRLRKLKKYSEGLRYSIEHRYWRWLEWTPRELVSSLLIKPMPDAQIENFISDKISSKDLNTILLADQQFLLPNDMLTKVDRMSMANGLEVRTPFLDHHMVHFVNQLPFHWKRNKSVGKYILREAFKKDLPKDVLKAPKRGFEIPIEQWLRHELSPQILAYSKKQLIEDQAVFKYETLQKIIAEFISGKNNSWAPTIWSYLVFQNWWFNLPSGTIQAKSM